MATNRNNNNKRKNSVARKLATRTESCSLTLHNASSTFNIATRRSAISPSLLDHDNEEIKKHLKEIERKPKKTPTKKTRDFKPSASHLN